MRPNRGDIAAPVFARSTVWVGEEPGQMSALTARGPVLVHFFDFAQLNSIRGLPYVLEWRRRYADAGLVTLGVHSPRHPFTADRDALGPAFARLEIEHPVADDSGYAIWRDYGCEGWPSLFLWGRGGALRWFHFGEGEYRATELAIQDELEGSRQAADHREPVDSIRATDAPGAAVVAPTPELLPGGAVDRPFAPEASEALELDYAAGAAYATVDGRGRMAVRIDGGEADERAVAEPGLVELAEHETHGEHSLELVVSPGVRVWAISFAPGVPG